MLAGDMPSAPGQDDLTPEQLNERKLELFEARAEAHDNILTLMAGDESVSDDTGRAWVKHWMRIYAKL